MELSVINSNKYLVTGVSIKEQCLVTEFLNELDGNYQSNIDGMLALMERISLDGLENLSTNLCHEVDKNEKIYELIKGKIRVFFFKGVGNHIVVCTTGLLKKTQKANVQHIEKAIKFKNSYFEANKNNKLKILEY